MLFQPLSIKSFQSLYDSLNLRNLDAPSYVFIWPKNEAISSNPIILPNKSLLSKEYFFFDKRLLFEYYSHYLNLHEDVMKYDKIVIDQKRIERCVSKLAKEISLEYNNIDNVMLLVILNGARKFARDLVDQINLEFDIDYITASSYQGGTLTTGNVTISSQIDSKIEGKNILIIDDIFDTGLTLNAVINHVKKYNPNSVKTCVLLKKNKTHKINIPIDFMGQDVEDSFLVGYGLDYKEKYRQLPVIVAVNSTERIKDKLKAFESLLTNTDSG